MTKICSIAHIEIYGMLLESHVYIYIYIHIIYICSSNARYFI